MIEELVLGTETEMCGEFGSGYIESQKHTEVLDAGQVVQCIHIQRSTASVFTEVKVTGTATLADTELS